MSGRTDPSPSRLPIVLIGVLLLGIIARLVWLDRLPGIDGDEAQYGVNVQVFRDGGVPFWRTGVGNLLNPFHSLPLLALSYVMAPSGALLRMPEAIWGVLAILIAYPMFARPLGHRAAILIAAWLALSPTAIGYSRFGWDPSGTPLACVLAIGFALRQRPVAAVLSTIAALAIHPTNIFLVPIVVAGFAPDLSRRFVAMSADARRRVRIGAGVLIAIGAPLALWILNVLARQPKTSIPSVEIVLQRVLTPSAWLELGSGVLRLFTGVSAVADMAGPVHAASRMTFDVIAIGVLVLPILMAVRRERATPISRFRWLLFGVLASLVAFHVVAGPLALASGRERYGLFLLVPEIVLAAMALDALRPSRPLFSTGAIALTAYAFAALTIGSYFVPLVFRGGDARAGLRTGEVEPKVAAFDFLVADAGSAEVVAVIADDWYLYWPMRYLAGQDPRFHVELTPGANAPGGLYPPGVVAPPYPHPPDRIYALVFDNGGGWRRLREGGATSVFTAVDSIGRPILHVVRQR